MDNNKYLPLGSIVLLKGGKRKIMITGYGMKTEEKKDKVYDYNACLYPEGTLSSNNTLVFDHDQIETIFHLGFKDEDGKEYLDRVKNELEKYRQDHETDLN